MQLTVGTRGSQLSLIQTGGIVQKLRGVYPDIKVEVRIIKTKGDKLPEKPLMLIKGGGIFEKEIDKAVLSGEVDFAVHSMKDVPTIQPTNLVIAAVPEREPPNDALISKRGLRLRELPQNAIIGTSSPRRGAQVLRARPDLRIKPFRGNVETRVKKLMQGPYDAIILAEAGLRRLGMESYITERLSLEEFTPAPGQGTLAVVTRKDKHEVIGLLKSIDHPPSMAEARAERAFLRAIRGGCRVPLGAVARVHDNALTLYATLLSLDGRNAIQVFQTGTVEAPEDLGVKVAQEMLRLGTESPIKTGRGSSEAG